MQHVHTSHLLLNTSVQIIKYICPNQKIYLSKLKNSYVEVTKFICQNHKIVFAFNSNVHNLPHATCAHSTLERGVECICPNIKYICPNCKMYISKLLNVFVQITKYFCSNHKIYLSKLQNVFIQIEGYICPYC